MTLSMAALECPVVVLPVSQEVDAGADQKRAEAAPGPVDCGKPVLLQEGGEEALDEVLGRLGVVSPAADEGVEWIPVYSAQLGQRIASLGAVPLAAATTRLQWVDGNGAFGRSAA